MVDAVFIKNLTSRFRGDARLYRLDNDGDMDLVPYVVVSAVHDPITGIPETFIFPADEQGEVTSWGELDGSFSGSLDHSAAIAAAGWNEVK